MLADLQALGAKLGIRSNGNIESDARGTLDHLARLTEPWLLVYDNATNPDAVRNWLPTGAVRCIITSRYTEFSEIAAVTNLDLWSNVVTAGYLIARTGRNDHVGATRLAQQLGGLPLAAEQAAAYLSPRAGISFDDYTLDIARLINQPRPPGGKGEYPDTVYAAFVKSLETARVAPSGEVALDFIRICAFLSPDGVDLGLLATRGAEEVLPASLASTLADKFVREDALSILTSLSLLRREDGPFDDILIFHRLLLEVVRDWIGEDGRSLWGSVAVLLIAGVFPGGDIHAKPSSWLLCALLLPHVASLEAHAPRTGAAGKALAQVLSQASLYLVARGSNYVGALLLTSQSVELSRIVEDNPLALATRLNNLGSWYGHLGLLPKAEATLNEALSIEERLLGPNNPSLSITLSNLAGVHRDKEDFATAELLFRRVAKIRRATDGPKAAEYGLSLSNLGSLYGRWWQKTGKAAFRVKAERYLMQALTITCNARGTRHPETSTRHHNLATLRSETGDWPGAVSEAELALAIQLSLGLAGHPVTLHAVRNLADYYEQSGRSDKAVRLRRGDFSDLIPVITQIEAEHRAWVAEDNNSRRFGPASPFQS
jgi:tetratricopeptide (TPR) repeat protein